jgi:hypothetical protein
MGQPGGALAGVAEMTTMTSIHAPTADGRLASQRPRPWRQPPANRAKAADAPDDARISPRLVVPAVVAVSLLLWFAVAELAMLVIRLPLFS